MQGEIYHQSATLSVAPFNPYLPAIGRVLQVLTSLAPAGSTIQINNRDLAEAADLKSAGHIPRLLRQLEAHGRIERVTSSQGSLIVVVDAALIPHADQPFIASQSDPDQDQPDVMETRDQLCMGAPALIPHADPPTPPIRYKHDHDQQQPRGHESLRQKLIAAGETHRDRRTAETVAAQILEKTPI
jgi:hypothetical protein